MTGSIQAKSDKPYYYAVLNTYDEHGKRKPKWISTGVPVKGNNKRKANEALKKILAEYDLKIENKIDLALDVPFTDFISLWLDTEKKNLQPTTFDAYKLTLDSHIIPYFLPLKLKVSEVTAAHIDQYVNSKLESLSPNTVRKHIANLSKSLNSAVKKGIIAFNPVTRIETVSKVKYTGAKYYNERQIEELLEISKGDPLEIVILLTVFYGLRRSEVLGLKWDAISFENGTIAISHTVVQVTKTIHRKDSTKNDSSNDIVPLPDMIMSELKKWKEKQAEHRRLQPNDYIDEGYVCTQVDGSLMKPSYISQHFKLLLKKNNLPEIRYHDLRHSAASYLLHLGFNLKEIQTWLRHADIQTSMNLYTHLDLAAKREIANNLNDKFANLMRC